MNKRHIFLAILMLGLFSSASFASKTDNSSPDPEYSMGEDGFKGHWSGKPEKAWVDAVKDHKYCDIKGDKDWGSWGGHHGHHEGHGHHDGDGHHGDGDPDDGPSSVPLPSAIWLFGSMLLGLTGFKRKAGGSRMAV